MKVELHVNGAHQVILNPETSVELAILDAMAQSASKGRAVKLAASEDALGNLQSVVVSVEV